MFSYTYYLTGHCQWLNVTRSVCAIFYGKCFSSAFSLKIYQYLQWIKAKRQGSSRRLPTRIFIKNGRYLRHFKVWKYFPKFPTGMILYVIRLKLLPWVIRTVPLFIFSWWNVTARYFPKIEKKTVSVLLRVFSSLGRWLVYWVNFLTFPCVIIFIIRVVNHRPINFG